MLKQFQLSSTTNTATQELIIALSRHAEQVMNQANALALLSDGLAEMVCYAKALDEAKKVWFAAFEQTLLAQAYTPTDLHRQFRIGDNLFLLQHKPRYNFLRYASKEYKDLAHTIENAEKEIAKARAIMRSQEKIILQQHPKMEETADTRDVWAFKGNVADIKTI